MSRPIRSELVAAKLTPSEYEIARDTASKLGITLSTFIAEAVAERATRVRRVCPMCGRKWKNGQHATA
jgi:uncharacterized protein (DUF1778 family)